MDPYGTSTRRTTRCLLAWAEEREVFSTVTAYHGPTGHHAQGRSKEHVAQEVTVIGEAAR